MRQFRFLALGLVVAFFGNISYCPANAAGIPAEQQQLSNISPAILLIVIKQAAADFGIDPVVLKAKYDCGDCMIESETPKAYKVSYGGGMTIVILDDLL